MQKNNKKASILLWAVMLSLIIAILFISISTKINKNIKLSGKMNNFIEEKNKINIALTNSEITNNKAIIFKNNTQDIFGLKKQESKEFTFSGSSDFNINLGIINGGVVNYNYIFEGSTTASGIIDSSKSFTGKLNTTTKTGSLIIKNLSGYSKILLKSDFPFETSQKNYKIVTKIGNNFFNETKNAK